MTAKGMLIMLTNAVELFIGAVVDCKDEMMLMLTVLTVAYLVGLVMAYIRREEN